MMTDIYHFRTPNSERPLCESCRAPLPKHLAREESRRLASLNAARQTQEHTEAMIRDLKGAVVMLDRSIETELERVWIKDPAHFAFPMTVRALVARRDNLKATIAALCNRLATFEPA